MRIRPANAGDITTMIALERSARGAPHWAEDAYRQIFDNSVARIALVSVDEAGTVCGFVVGRVIAEECELENIVVAERSRKRGAGAELVLALTQASSLQDSKRIFLEVRESNAAARRLYEKCGFVETGRRTSYYSDPEEDAVLYRLQSGGFSS